MRNLKTLLVTIAVLLCSISMSAQDFKVDGIYYNITSSADLTVEMVAWVFNDDYTGSVTIPATVTYNSTTYRVTSIGERVFRNCSSLTSISIPASVTSIPSYAFDNCTGLKEIIFEDGEETLSLGYNKYYLSEYGSGEGLFYDCPLETVYLGRNLGYINYKAYGYSPFCGKGNLTSVIIGDKVTSINSRAFSGCSKLTSLVIPNGVTSIGMSAFVGCYGLKEIIFEDGEEVLSLSFQDGVPGTHRPLFFNCPLETIYLGRTLSYDSSYGNSPFDSQESLISLTIGNKVTSIGAYAFSQCDKLTSIVIPDAVTSIGDYAFYGCSGFTSLTIGDGVTSIGSSAFYGCSKITSVVIPDNVTSFGSSSFYGCSGLESAIIGNGVTSIGSSAFSGCVALKNLTIGSSVSSIEESAFGGCNEIESIYALNPKAITCNENIFATDAYNNATLYVPSDRVFAYEKVTPWNKFQIESMKKFSVTYMVDGEVYETIETEYAAEITLPDNPIKEGYTFMGWSEIPETMPANDITIYGSFAINKYLVTFKVGDEVIASDSLEYGASIVIPEIPQKEGYTFNGWGEVAKTVPAGDVTYEGNYSVNSYKLTFIVDGEVVQESSVAYGATITLPEEPTKEGYSFDGWNEIPETMPASDVTVSGTFTVNKYLVTFRINNEVIASDSLEYGASIVTPEAPEKEGYTFDGWANVPETVPACNLTIEGGYTANEYLLAFVVDGALYEMRKVRCDEKITALDMVERKGYTFVWENWIDKMPAKDYTVRGKYVPNKYAITYVADGEILATDSIAYGTAIEALKEPTKEGYTFSGWSEVPETMPAEDIVISGSFAVNTYKVYYYVGDVLVHTAEVAYGESIPEYVYEPTAEGDEFMGWVGETYETMPAHDVTYTANITNDISQCTISNSQLTIYDLNGRKIKADDLRELEKGIYIVNGKKVMIK